jgi:hypothetical protein
MQNFGVHGREEVPLVAVPGYMEWSERRLGEGESPVLIASLDAQSISVRPEEAAELDEAYFDGMLESMRDQAR